MIRVNHPGSGLFTHPVSRGKKGTEYRKLIDCFVTDPNPRRKEKLRARKNEISALDPDSINTQIIGLLNPNPFPDSYYSFTAQKTFQRRLKSLYNLMLCFLPYVFDKKNFNGQTGNGYGRIRNKAASRIRIRILGLRMRGSGNVSNI